MSLHPLTAPNTYATAGAEALIEVWITPVRERGAYLVILMARERLLNDHLLPSSGWPLAVMDDFGDLRGVQP